MKTDDQPAPATGSKATAAEIIAVALYCSCAVLAVCGPYAITVWFSIYWACLAAVIIFMAWVMVMPCTCSRGGLYASMVAMAIMLHTCGFVLVTEGLFVFSLF